MITDIHGFAVFHQEDQFLQLPCARLVNNRRGLIAIGVIGKLCRDSHEQSHRFACSVNLLEIIAVQENDGSLDFVNRRKILGFNIFVFLNLLQSY